MKSCVDHTTMPMDGFTLTEALHRHGINIRYLGTVLEFIEKSPEKSKLDHVYVSAHHFYSIDFDGFIIEILHSLIHTN